VTEIGFRKYPTARLARLRGLFDLNHRAVWYATINWVLCIATLVALICNKIYGLGPEVPGIAIILPPLAVVTALQFLLIQINRKQKRPPPRNKR
jgi:hypothetical protein